MDESLSEKSSSGPQVIKHWILLSVLWILVFFEQDCIFEILHKWSDPSYQSNYAFINSFWGEVVAFALCTVMALYTIGITAFILIYSTRNRFKNTDYQGLSQLHLLVLSAFVVYWLIFILLFFKP